MLHENLNIQDTQAVAMYNMMKPLGENVKQQIIVLLMNDLYNRNAMNNDNRTEKVVKRKRPSSCSPVIECLTGLFSTSDNNTSDDYKALVGDYLTERYG